MHCWPESCSRYGAWDILVSWQKYTPDKIGITKYEIAKTKIGIKWRVFLTFSLQQASVPAPRIMTLEDERPLDRHASGDRNVKFKNRFNTNFSTRCGATCYIMPSRMMSQLLNGVIFAYRSVEVYWTFCSYLRVLLRFRNFYNGGRY